jgi:hypothetical protein
MVYTVFQKVHVLQGAKVKENMQTFILEGIGRKSSYA